MARHSDYSWLDDPFNETKQDPLDAKGMGGCAGTTVALAVIAIIALVAIIGFGILMFEDLVALLSQS